MKTAIKPRKMYLHYDGTIRDWRDVSIPTPSQPVIVLPADAASVEALREKIETAAFANQHDLIKAADAILALLKLSRGRRGKTS